MVLGLTCAVVLGAALRFHHLGKESLWLDEAFSVQLAHSSLSTIVTETAKDVHPPLYYVALHYWVRVAGDSERAVRLLSALASIATIVVLCRLATHLFGRATGVTAAFFAAVSPFQVEFAQEARMYALLALFSVSSIYFLVRLLDARERHRRWVFAGYVLTTTLMMYTQVYSVFIVTAEALVLVSTIVASTPDSRRLAKIAALGLAIAVLLFLPWLPILLRQIFHVQRGFWISGQTPGTLADMFVLYAGSDRLAWMLSGLAVLGIAAGVVVRRAPATSRRLTMAVALLWLACPILLPLVISRFSEPIFLPKYTIVGSLAFIVLAARGATILPGALRAWGAIAMVAVAACWSWTPLHDYYAATRKVEWREAVANVDRVAHAQDVVLFNQPYAKIPFDYYSHRSDVVKVPFLKDHDDLGERSLTEVLTMDVRGHDRVWLVLSNPDELSPLMVRQLTRSFQMSSHTASPGLEIYLFVRPARQK